MEYIKFCAAFLLVLFIYVGVIKVFMNLANRIGERLGLGKFFMSLLLKNKK